MCKSVNIVLVLIFACFAGYVLSAGEAKEESGDFPFKLFRIAIDENPDRNVVLSPNSLKSTLMLLETGAVGETGAEIRSLLGISDKNEDQAVFVTNEQNVVAFASLWLQKDAPILPEFRQKAKKRFDAEVRLVDFAGNVNDATQKINAWVAEKTKDRIPLLYDRLDPISRLVVADAVVFEDRWKTAFAEEETFSGEFTLPGGEKIKTDLMSRTGSFQHKEGNEALILELPYKTAGYSMLILLPSNNMTLAEMETKISAEKLAEWCGELEKTELEVQLPKFALESETPCNEILRKLGVKQAFSREADFSRINGLHDLYLSDVKQRVFLRVDESGTEAAAVTGAVLKPKAMLKETKPFYVNRPFLFVIRHRETSNILFLGRIVDPREKVPQGKIEEETVTTDPSLRGEGGSFN